MADINQQNQKIHLIVKDKNGIILEEDSDSISSYNEVGLFDVLPLHINFISLVKQKLIVHKGKENKEVPIGIGLIKVMQNVAHVYLGLPDPDEKINDTGAVEMKS